MPQRYTFGLDDPEPKRYTFGLEDQPTAKPIPSIVRIDSHPEMKYFPQITLPKPVATDSNPAPAPVSTTTALLGPATIRQWHPSIWDRLGSLVSDIRAALPAVGDATVVKPVMAFAHQVAQASYNQAEQEGKLPYGIPAAPKPFVPQNTAQKVAGFILPQAVDLPLWMLGEKVAGTVLAPLSKLAPVAKAAEALPKPLVPIISGGIKDAAAYASTVAPLNALANSGGRPQNFVQGLIDQEKQTPMIALGGAAMRGAGKIIGKIGGDFISSIRAGRLPEVQPAMATETPLSATIAPPKPIGPLRVVTPEQKALDALQEGIQAAQNYIGHNDVLAAYPAGTTIEHAFADIKAKTGYDLPQLTANLEASMKEPSQIFKLTPPRAQLGRAAGVLPGPGDVKLRVPQLTRTMTAEVKPPVLTGKAVWSNNGIDYPVEVTGYTGKFNGRQYVNVAGSKSAVPLDEIKLTNDVSPTLKPQSAAAPGFDLKPNLNGRSSGQANTVGLTVSPELKAYPELGLHGNPLKQATTTPLREVATARDVTLDSSIIPGLRQFVDEDVLPKSKSTVHGIRDTFNSIRGLLFPRSTISEPALNAVMRFKGLRDKELFVAERTMSGIKDMFNKMPQREQIEFLDRFKRGMAQKNPELQALADEYQRADDAMYSEIAKYKPSLTYKENHFRIFWKVVPGQQEAKGFEGLFRGPLQGTRGFMKQSTLQDVSEGIAKGGVPVSTNPQTLFELGQADAMRYVTAQRMWQELKGIDMVKFVKMGNRIPEGFTTLNDRIANVYFPVKEGLVNSGSWYVEKNVARLLNNYLSRDLIRETPVGRFFIGLKNLTTSIELSLSPFHFVFETIEAMGSKMGIGLTRMVNQGVLGLNPRQFAKGALEVLSTPFAPYNFAKTGGRAIKYISNPGEFIQTMGGRRFLNQFPEARQIIDDLFTGGGKLAMNEDYRINTLDTFKSNLHSGNFIGAALRAFPSLNEQVMKPLFEIYIPRLKIGLFFHEYGQQLEQHAEDLLSGKMSRERLAREVWDRTENKFGEMNFDNLFWNRTFKSALQLLFRSVTWKLGNIRGFGSAILGQGKNLLDMKNGRVPRLDPGMAWLMGMLTTTAAISTILQKALTGKDPQELKDFVYPQVGGTDKDGNPNRLSIPTYFRDAVSLTHSPVDYTKNSLSGMVSKLSDILQNKDFFGNYIYDPKDPAWKQFLDSVGYFTPKPFVLTQVQNLQKNNTTPAVQALGFAGFLKAPREIIQSKFQQELSKAYGDQIPDKSLTPVEQKKAQLKRDLKDKIFYGKITDTEAKDFALQNGLYTPKYVDQFIKDAKLPPMVYMWKQLGDAERAQILPLATPAEVTRLREYGVLERVKKPSVNSIGNSLVPKLPQLPKIKLPAVK